ncbi:carotenoid biosynthesis protein [Mucilaginibacter sp.]|uniref:carotenoid biosynthesis protein n=1 Tax=Mucilaginibacter sp. TaxID=1882438 RepID=UPI0025E4CD37|nr:carotenoid biosynthesis protein [Mucilaginibacter sp.]
MEGTQNLNSHLSTGSAKTERIAIVIIVLFHIVGLIGFVIPSLTVLFIKLVPWHLLLMAGVIVYSYNQLSTKFLLFGLLVFTIGFSAELIGVHTGLLFGNYSYGETLGIKLFNVPLMIGVNWFLLIFSTGVLMQRSRIKNIYTRVIAGALVLTFLDMLIEPVAVHFDYWHWVGNSIPLKNYFCWFILSAAMLFVFEKFQFKPQSKAAAALLIMQFVFFIVLELMN